MDFYTFRIYGSIAVILGCFIFLYPKLLHPLISAMIGTGSNKDRDADDFVPPPMRNRNPSEGESRQDIPENIRRSMRHGPHPGMRAAAQEQSKQSKGSGRGMMGVILPMYAVGIVVYLIYTLCKVFNKKDEKSSRGERRSPTRLVPSKEMREDDQYSEEEGSVSMQSCDRIIDHLEQADSDMDMRKLQERLAETEAQMTKILSAMKAVQGKVDTVSGDTDTATGAEAAPAATSKQQPDQKVTSSDKQNDSSAESTPDSESYEIVNRSNDESNGEDKATAETVKSKTNESLDTHEEENDDEEESKQEDDQQDSEEVEDVLLKDKSDKDDDETLTVRKRIPKAEADS